MMVVVVTITSSEQLNRLGAVSQSAPNNPEQVWMIPYLHSQDSARGLQGLTYKF